MVINVIEYLERSAKLFPNNEALGDEKNTINYTEYLNKSKIIGTYIANRVNYVTNYPIAVIIDRNIESIITFMGIVFSGNFYVPIDGSMPEERKNIILSTIKPIMIINTKAEDCHDDYIRYETLLSNASIDNELLDSIKEKIIDVDPLYTIFTSGSTGLPKGVTITHKGVIDLVESFEDAFNFEKESVFGNQAPFDFDVSTKDIYNALKVGGKVQVIPKRLFMMPKLLLQYLNDKKINVLIWSVSALRILAEFKALNPSNPAPINYVMMCGEVMPMKALNYWRDNYPNARYVNLYGPTEITCNCLYYVVDRLFSDDEVMPIGKSFRNTRVLLFDDNKKLIKEKNEVGEIYVGGSCLALGYWNNAERTKSAFVQNPLINEVPSTLYATGDIAYYDKDNNLVFAARRDNQIKHMGHRIELGEVETALNSISYIDVACCIYNENTKKIVCFYQSKKDNTESIVKLLLKKLPKYMCPNQYVYYEHLPLNTHGKIDRQKLIKENF